MGRGGHSQAAEILRVLPRALHHACDGSALLRRRIRGVKGGVLSRGRGLRRGRALACSVRDIERLDRL